MDEVDELFYPFPQRTRRDLAVSRAVSDPGSYSKELSPKDPRMAQLLVLLQQLDESAGGLAACRQLN
jgi:hypothetical protein